MSIMSKSDRDRIRQRSAAKRTVSKSNFPHINIENPDFQAHCRAGRGNPAKVRAAVNAKEGVIVTMYARKQLRADQFKAAQRFLAIFDMMGGAGARAIDYSRPVTDCGAGNGGSFSERIVTAGRELDECKNMLGILGFELVCDIVGKGMTIRDIAGSDDRRRRDFVVDLLRQCLSALSSHWGYSSAKIRSWHA